MNSESQVVRNGMVSLKEEGFASFSFLRRWLVLTGHSLVIHKTESSSVQSTVMLEDITNIEHVELKPYCLLLETKYKRYQLALKNDEELYGWKDDIYSRSPLVRVSGLTNFVHKVHVAFDPITRTFSGMPEQWTKLLMISAGTREDHPKDPQAVLDFVKFYPGNLPEDRELEEMGMSAISGDGGRVIDPLPPWKPISILPSIIPSRGSAHEETQAVDTPSLEEIRSQFSRNSDLTMYITRDGEFPIAAGGYADIYKGTFHPSRTGIKVAIKVIKVYSGEDKSNSPKKTKRLRREMKVWMRLNHANVLSLFGTTLGFGPFPAMVCPWLDNGTLTSYLTCQKAGLKIQQVLALIHDVASGLQYLHSQYVVHGDLSGSNVLIDAKGSACIADFGLSTVLGEIGSTFGTSSTGKPRGTLRWAAPELLGLVDTTEMPHTRPTMQSDMYSFGSIMFQILSGKVPYHYYAFDMQIVGALFRGETPTRPDDATMTDLRWIIIQRCWSPFKHVVLRPSSREIVAFSRDDLCRHGDVHVA